MRFWTNYNLTIINSSGYIQHIGLTNPVSIRIIAGIRDNNTMDGRTVIHLHMVQVLIGLFWNGGMMAHQGCIRAFLLDFKRTNGR